MPPFDGETAREMIRKDLGRPPSQIFRHFEESPLSAASIGQVHACVLPDGREAVIKLQRPDIRERMTTDLRIMHRLGATLQKHTKLGKSANLVGVVQDLHANTFKELNPALEAFRQDRFRTDISAFGDNQFITAPEVYWDYCGPHMICMERMTRRADGRLRRHRRPRGRRLPDAAPRREGVARGGRRARLLPRRRARRQPLGARRRSGLPTSTSGSWASCPRSGATS